MPPYQQIPPCPPSESTYMTQHHCVFEEKIISLLTTSQKLLEIDLDETHDWTNLVPINISMVQRIIRFHKKISVFGVRKENYLKTAVKFCCRKICHQNCHFWASIQC